MPSAQDIPGLVAFSLPGFIALAILASLTGPRKRSQIEWVAWSVTGSVVIGWISALILGGPPASLSDWHYQVAQLILAVGLALVIWLLLKIPVVGPRLSRLGTMTEPKVWNGLIEPHQWVQIKMKTGEDFYGQVGECTNDPNEDRIELFLDNVRSRDPESGEWEGLGKTRGIYIPGDQMRWIQILE